MLMLCLRYVKNLQDAEEVMLNGFFKFFKTIDLFVFNEQSGIGGWLKKIMVNECLMFLRKQGALKIADEGYAAEVASDDDQLSRMNANEIFRLITVLPVGYRTVFNLFAVEGFSHKEIAAMLSISEGTSKSQLNKARIVLQKAIKENVL